MRSFASWSNFLGMFEDFHIYPNGTKPGALHSVSTTKRPARPLDASLVEELMHCSLRLFMKIPSSKKIRWQALYGASTITTLDPDYCVAEGWFCLGSGAQLVFISDGDWRHAESSKFRLLWCSPNDDIRDLTPSIEDCNKFDATQTGATTYTKAFDACRDRITKYVNP